MYPGTVQYIPQPGTAAVPMVYNRNAGFIVTPSSHIAGKLWSVNFKQLKIRQCPRIFAVLFSVGTTVVEQRPPPYYYGQGAPQESFAGVHQPKYY